MIVENISFRECMALEQATHRSCRCPLPGGVQGQTVWVSGQPNAVASNSVHSREGLEINDL